MLEKNSGLLFVLALSIPGFASAAGPSECADMEVWDYGMAMCMPLPMKDMPQKMTMLMLHGHAFGVFTSEAGPRGVRKFSAPNVFMADLGRSVGDLQYVNLDLMGTFEKWTFASSGYPELLQVGERNAQGEPFIDAQHPHSSPIMGLTLSDTIALGAEQNHLKLSVAPRGESTEGPIAFMHRPTGMVNPDAPLGHHIGQDVGHISSTVLAGSLRQGSTTYEISTFHGEEPEPTKIDLPLGAPNSYAARVIQEFSPTVFAMASTAYVKSPEADDPEIPFVARYSASVYHQHDLGKGWTVHNALIYGLVTKYDHASSLNSFAEEFLLHQSQGPNVWGRLEVLQRTPAELLVATSGDSNSGRWVTAATLGYTHDITQAYGVHFGLGASVAKDFLPAEFQGKYGGYPWTGRVFLQVGGMGMWDLSNLTH